MNVKMCCGRSSGNCCHPHIRIYLNKVGCFPNLILESSLSLLPTICYPFITLSEMDYLPSTVLPACSLGHTYIGTYIHTDIHGYIYTYMHPYITPHPSPAAACMQAGQSTNQPTNQPNRHALDVSTLFLSLSPFLSPFLFLFLSLSPFLFSSLVLLISRYTSPSSNVNSDKIHSLA